MIYKHMHHI